MSDKTCRQCGRGIIVGLDGLCADCYELRDKPDKLSLRTHIGGTPFQDMKQLDERQRFQLIAGHLRQRPGKAVGVMVETGGKNQGKGDRYIAGVKEQLPEAKVVSRTHGPVPGTETIVFKLEPTKEGQ